jgi:hypothetical protein
VTRDELFTLLAVAVGWIVLMKFGGLRFWHALLMFAAGFYLAAFTPAGSQIATLWHTFLTASGH